MHFSDTFSKRVIFSEKIYYEFETFRTTKIAPIFNGLLSKNHEKLHLVAQMKQNSNQILLDIKNIYKLKDINGFSINGTDINKEIINYK